MNALPHPAQEPVDNPDGLPPSNWSGYTPSQAGAEERSRRLAAAWFDPLWRKGAGDAEVYGWRFTCPFCGEHREDCNYRETYAAAYRHLMTCEWTDRYGVGPMTF